MKFLKFFAVLLAAAALILTVTPGTGVVRASADIVRGTGCVFFDANGTPFVDPAATFQIVATNNGNGTVNARCQGTLTGGVLPSKAMHFDGPSTGFTCLGGVDEWKMTVTPSGNGSFTCHIPE